MNVLVIGSGSREHALCWKLSRSPKVTGLYCAPGNAGTAMIAKNVPVKADDVQGLVKAAADLKIDLTVVGPEVPLALGVVDEFERQGRKIFGPTRAAATIEASKAFAKEIMESAGVPTARSRSFTDKTSLEKYLADNEPPLVLKSDGLAQGKGVFVCMSREEVSEAVDQIYSQLKSERVLVEDYLTGNEVSFIVATDGTRVVPFSSSHDYKRLLDGQKGPNTGGMGAVSPSLFLPSGDEARVLREVIEPTLAEMRRRGTAFRGFLYAGLMISEAGQINVLEFNARLGDPECQALIRRMDFDLVDLLVALLEGPQSPIPPLAWNQNASAAVVMAAPGYPNSPKCGDEIFGLEFSEMLPDTVVFHGGTTRDAEGKLRTSGGRVLTVTSLGSDPRQAAQNAYRTVDLIQFKGCQSRRDIGAEGR